MTPCIIGLCGPDGVGKSTTASAIVRYCADREVTAVKMSFATPLYRCLSQLFGVDTATMVADKNTPMTAATAPVPSLVGLTWRQLLRSLGTQWGRDLVGPQLWVELSQRAIAQARASFDGITPDLVVFDDVRFESEAAICTHVIELQRAGVAYSAAHSSAAGLPSTCSRMLFDVNKPADMLAAHLLDRIGVLRA